MTPGGSGSGEGRGFSLVELVIAMAVASVGLLLAAGILVQAYRMLGQTAVHARIPVADLAIQRLRADLQGAAGIVRGPGGGGARRGGEPAPWSRDRLTLLRPDGSGVRYETRRGRLVRSLVQVRRRGDRTGGDPGRPVLDRVISWRWREVAPRLVTIELVLDRPGPGRGRIVDPVQRGRGRGELRTVRQTVALRGGGLGWGW